MTLQVFKSFVNGLQLRRTFARDEFESHHYIPGDFFVADLSPVRFDESFARKEDYVFTVPWPIAYAWN